LKTKLFDLKTEVARTWRLAVWLKELLEAFPVDEATTIKYSDAYSVFGLANLYPFETETVSQFHIRFNTYLKRIDKLGLINFRMQRKSMDGVKVTLLSSPLEDKAFRFEDRSGTNFETCSLVERTP
jgi:hypothetical protein